MPAPFEGGCRCGAVRYTCNAEPAQIAHCHCRACQYASGGGYSTVVIVPAKALQRSGEVRGYKEAGESGKAVRRQFCPQCGTPLFSRLETAPGVVVLKAASLDDPGWLKPQAHIYCESAQPWSIPETQPPKFEKMPG